ncbi:MAG: fibronectin type III domain-containing protein [Bacteroidia bacterium]|nr:fibronectin type III domain-containing protein [Bacteroidia bacterium]
MAVLLNHNFDAWPLGVLTESQIATELGAGADVKFLNGNVEVIASGSGRALRFSIPANTWGFTAGSRFLYRWTDAGKPVQAELYIEYDLTIQSPFDAGLGGKLPVAVFGSKIPDNQTIPVQGDGWSDIIMWKQSGVNKGSGNLNNTPAANKFELKHFTYAISNAGSPFVYNDYAENRYWLNQANNNRYEYSAGTTYRIVRYIKMNDLGVANGIMQTWVDGVLVHSFSGYNFRGSLATEGLYGVDFLCFAGGNNITFGVGTLRTFILDNIKVSTDNPFILAPTAVDIPTNVQLVGTTATGVTISGNYLPFAGFQQIVVQRSTDGTNFANIGQFLANTTWGYQDSGLTPNSTYYYRVKAIDGNGVLADSAYSATLTAVTNSFTGPDGDFILQYSLDGGSTWEDAPAGNNALFVSSADYAADGFQVRRYHIPTGCATVAEDIAAVPALGSLPAGTSVCQLDITGGVAAITVDGRQSRSASGQITGALHGNYRFTFILENESTRPQYIWNCLIINGVGNVWDNQALLDFTAAVGLTFSPPGAFDGTFSNMVKNSGESPAFAYPIRVIFEYDAARDGNYSAPCSKVIPTFHTFTGEQESQNVAQASVETDVPTWPVGGISRVSGAFPNLYDGSKYNANTPTSGNWEVFEHYLPGDSEVNTTVYPFTVTATLRASIVTWLDDIKNISVTYSSDAKFVNGVDRNSSYYITGASGHVQGYGEFPPEFYIKVREVATGNWFKMIFSIKNQYTR